MRLIPSRVWLAGFCLLATSAPAGAVTLGFGCITGNLASDCAIGEAQVSVEVTDPGSGQIAFTFQNVGGEASSITQVYWDDDAGVLLGIFSITDTPGDVEFTSPATPEDLPGGNDASPPFAATLGFSADSDPPGSQNGVNPGEILLVTFDLQGGQTFADAIAALTDGSLRIGIHVQAFESEGGESFVNNPVPEPGTLALVSGGLLALARGSRHRHPEN